MLGIGGGVVYSGSYIECIDRCLGSAVSLYYLVTVVMRMIVMREWRVRIEGYIRLCLFINLSLV